MMRNSYIIDRAFNHYITASILTAVVSQLAVMTDAIIVGQFIAPEALSAINAATPLTMAVNAMYLLFVMGANVRLARLIGRQDQQGVRHLFMSIVWSVIPVGLLITAALYTFASPIAAFLCKEPSISHYTAQYLKAYSFGVAPMLLYLGFNTFVQTAGKPRLASVVIITSNVFNIVFDLLFVGALGFGIAGSAWATVMSYVCGLMLIATFGIRRLRLFRMQVQRLGVFLKNVLQNVREGLPVALGNICIGALVFLLNTIIVHGLGVMGMNIWSICLQVLMLSLVVINGTTGCIYAVGGIICGEEDWKGLRLFELRVVKVLILSIVLFVLVVEVNPLWLASIFGADEHMRAAGLSRALRLFFLCEIPFAYIFIRQAMLQLLEYRLLASVIAIAQLMMMLGGAWCASLIDPQLIWGSFPVAMFTVLAAMYLAMFVIHRRKRQTSIVSLIPTVEEPLMLVCSVECTADGVAAASGEMEAFVKAHSSHAGQALERLQALTSNLLERTDDGNGRYCDVLINFKVQEPFVKVRDIQKPFDAARFAYEASYEVMNGQNVTTIKIP